MSSKKVYLFVDQKEYHPGMTWLEMREKLYNLPYGVSVCDTNNVALQLYRFKNGLSGYWPLDHNKIHVSTPVIISKNYRAINLTFFFRTNQLSGTTTIDLTRLERINDHARSWAIPIDISDLKK